jgi:hypothetical protein
LAASFLGKGRAEEAASLSTSLSSLPISSVTQEREIHLILYTYCYNNI